MSNRPLDESAWDGCPQGTLVELARRRRGQRRQRSLARGTAALALCLAVAAGLLWIAPRAGLGPSENYFGGIACSEVGRLLPQYMDQRLEDPVLADKIRQHLAECSVCQERVRQMQVRTDPSAPSLAMLTPPSRLQRPEAELSWLPRDPGAHLAQVAH